MALKAYIQVALYRQSRLLLGTCIFLHIYEHTYMSITTINKKAYEFEREPGSVCRRVWKEWRERGNEVIILWSPYKNKKGIFKDINYTQGGFI